MTTDQQTRTDHIPQEGALTSRHITLLRPPVISSINSFSAPVTPPLAIAYLTAALKNAGFNVTPVDALGEAIEQVRIYRDPECRVRGLTTEEIVQRIPSHTDIIAVSCMFTQEWAFIKQVIRAVKKAFPAVPIIVGGEHATALPEEILADCPEVDMCALGEGEETIVDIARFFPRQPQRIPSIVYRAPGGEIRRTEKRTRIRDIEDIPRPAWDDLPLETYLGKGYAHGVNAGRTIPMLATRGCPFQCTFCSNKVMWTQRYYTRSPEDVVDEIQEYKRKYGIQNIDFADLTAIVKKDWIIKFGQLLKERHVDVSWSLPSGTRSEALDADVTKLMAETNCKYLVYAAESGSPRVLKEIKKEVKLDRMLESMKAAKRNGLTLRCNFIIGFPRERRSDVYRTLLFQWRCAFAGVDDAPLFLFSPYPGTELFDYLRKTGKIPAVNDDYFQSLLCYMDLTRGSSYCETIGSRELNFYRLIGMAVFYFLSYLIYPGRIVRSVRNIFVTRITATVFEQRLVEMFRMKKILKKNCGQAAQPV
ncbi:MAG: cobalamin-dependent protein [Candidatus Omnitrophota bacterium]|nr:cobalamin-dependent protein [Candidatus Omnitrophota bacterium]MDZ4243366.1 cobalamin-dependent protein [Candidatus Omnitrophota bacterium]